jgi:hypothetical protein
VVLDELVREDGPDQRMVQLGRGVEIQSEPQIHSDRHLVARTQGQTEMGSKRSTSVTGGKMDVYRPYDDVGAIAEPIRDQDHGGGVIARK